MKKRQQGFTLIEIILSLSIGLVLFSGIVSVFIGMKTTTQETNSLGVLQENGRFALSVISEDLQRQNFFGDFAGPLTSSAFPSPNLPVMPIAGDCIGPGLNNASFPQAVGSFRTLWGVTASTATPLNCINNARIGSDILQLKRVLTLPLVPVPPALAIAPNANANLFYLSANLNQGSIFPGNAAVPDVNGGRVWQYLHHVYYVANQAQGNITVPVLMQGVLSNAPGTNLMVFQPIIDGIELIHFMYGVDTTNDGSVNAYISANRVTNNFWDNVGTIKIVAVKVYILARDIRPDLDFNNTTTYWLGDLPFTPPAGDNFRRLLFTSTVTLYNAGANKRW